MAKTGRIPEIQAGSLKLYLPYRALQEFARTGRLRPGVSTSLDVRPGRQEQWTGNIGPNAAQMRRIQERFETMRGCGSNAQYTAVRVKGERNQAVHE